MAQDIFLVLTPCALFAIMWYLAEINDALRSGQITLKNKIEIRLIYPKGTEAEIEAPKNGGEK